MSKAKKSIFQRSVAKLSGDSGPPFTPPAFLYSNSISRNLRYVSYASDSFLAKIMDFNLGIEYLPIDSIILP